MQAIRRYADPEFHVEVYRIAHPSTGVEHIVISVPGGQTVPVMSKRDCEGVIAQNLNRCVRAQREDMLDAIRAIVTGRVEVAAAAASAEDEFAAFVTAARQRWTELVTDLPAEMPDGPSGRCRQIPM
jgi:hypothetical protein